MLRGDAGAPPDCPTQGGSAPAPAEEPPVQVLEPRRCGSAGGKGYLFLATYDVEDNREGGKILKWVFSTDPSVSLSIKGLAERLQAAEAATDQVPLLRILV